MTATLEELKKKFIVSEEDLRSDLETVISRALNYCVVDQAGTVHVKDVSLKTKEKIKLILAPRLFASLLEPTIGAGVSGDGLAQFTGIPKNQVQARMKEIIDEDKFATSEGGVYTANAYKARQFITTLGKTAA